MTGTGWRMSVPVKAIMLVRSELLWNMEVIYADLLASVSSLALLEMLQNGNPKV